MSDIFRLGVLGRGTVGAAFIEMVRARSQKVQHITGMKPEIVGVLSHASTESDFDRLLSESDLIVELIGGIEPARTYVLKALAAGRHVVSANKQLISSHGEELYRAARDGNVQLRFEGAVAGAVPVVRVVSESFAGARITGVHGIVNGTTNYILSEMAARGLTFAEALGEAQRLGYAEADPSDDVDGRDAAAKMAIIARLAFGVAVSIEQVSYEGIREITPYDLAYAREFGLSLKLIGAADLREDGLAIWVHPVFLYAGHPLASVSGSFNAVTVESPDFTEITMSGPGAGGPQTATAVLGDVISAMIPPASSFSTPVPIAICTDTIAAFYLHLEVADEPGVLAAVAKLLAGHQVSVQSVLQRGGGDQAHLVMVVHPVLESQFYAALEEIAELRVLRAPPRVIRVLEEEFQ